MDDLIKRLEAGVREVGLHDDNNTELFDIEEANDTMFDAKAMIEAQAREIARLKVLIDEIGVAWEWWRVDEYDRCITVVEDAIREARQALAGANHEPL